MTIATATNEPAAPGVPAPLTPRPDQHERWIAHREPVDPTGVRTSSTSTTRS